jgi:repressor LexA
MAKANISDRQTKILDFIRKFIDAHGFPPSVRDIQEGLSVSSTSVVDYNLKALEERQLIRRGKGISRAIELLEDEAARMGRDIPRSLSIPLSPVPIAAGKPIPVLGEVMASSDQYEISSMVLGRYAAHPEDLFALPVKGLSMIDAFINDGDIVIVHIQDTAEIGQTVVAWLHNEQEATLKKYYPEGPDRVRLQPANETMDPIYTTPDNLEIKGRVVSVVRTIA